jgi:hypothetical protein
MSPPPKTPLPDWNPAGPRGKVRPRTFDEKVADDLRELGEAREREKATLKNWHEEADRKAKERQAYEQAHAGEWMERRSRCSNSLAILANQIKIRKNNWSNVAIDVSKAYETAYTSLTKMLDDENAHDQFLFNLAFAALAAVSAGGLAVIFTKAGEKWLRSGVTQLFVDAAEDAVQTGVGGVLTNVVPPLLAAEAKYEAIAIPSPFNFRGELDKLLNDMESAMLQWCIDRQNEIKELPLSDFEFYDPQKLDNEIARYLAEKDKKFNSQPFFDQKSKGELATELEKLMVGLWSASFCVGEFTEFTIRLPRA